MACTEATRQRLLDEIELEQLRYKVKELQTAIIGRQNIIDHVRKIDPGVLHAACLTIVRGNRV